MNYKILILILTFVYFQNPGLAAKRVDHFEDGNNRNDLNQMWYTFKDALSEINFTTNESPGANNSASCAKISWTLNNSGTYPYIGVFTNIGANGTMVDLSAYAGIRFKAKGSGIVAVQLPIEATMKEYNHYTRNIILSNVWQNYELSFKEFVQTYGTSSPFNLSTLVGFQFNISGPGGSKGEMFVDEIEFYLSGEASPSERNNVIIPNPKVNQLGYLPYDQKHLTIANSKGLAAKSFELVTAKDSTSVYSKNLSNTIINDSLSSGESVIRGDFSDFAEEGKFRIKVSNLYSEEFKIEKNLYEKLYSDALRTFYINRCGTEVNDVPTGIYHKACHLQDTLIRESTLRRDFTGAWHNAGDFGKWTNINSLNIAYFLSLYELRRGNDTLDIELRAELSSLLEEAKWGLGWLFKMQNTDGSVYHKVDSERNFVFGKSPEKDTLKRFAAFQSADQLQEPSTIDAATFTAVMLQAYRVLSHIERDLATKCKNAALLSWKWLEKNPEKAQGDFAFTDESVWDDLLWAKAEMVRFSNDELLRRELINTIQSIDYSALFFTDVRANAFWTMYFDPNNSTSTKTLIEKKVIKYADYLLGIISSSGYGVSLKHYEFWWESNENIVHRANSLLFAYLITNDKVYKDNALKQLDYLLGLNSLNFSFIGGYGSNSIKRPHHWAYGAYGKVLPGWMAGGANQYPELADPLLLIKIQDNTPPAKCYVDEGNSVMGSWASNEGQTLQASALAFLTGCLNETINLTSTLEPNRQVTEKKGLINSASIENDKLTIKLEVAAGEEVEIYLFDITGKLMLKDSEDSRSKDHTYLHPVVNLPNGVYFLKVVSNNGTDRGVESLKIFHYH